MNLTMKQLKLMTDYGFYTAEELKTLDDSDLSFEIADAAILNKPEGDSYLNLLITELQLRNSK
jgi:hypothetical protein